MLVYKLFLLLIALKSCMGADNEITRVYKRTGVIPDVLDKAPKEYLRVNYPNRVRVNRGNELTPTQVMSIPTVKWTANANSYYTLLMTGVDAPNRQTPLWREWLHWGVVNIPGTDVQRGEILCPYLGAAVPKSSGLNRFTLFVFKQPERLIFNETPINNTSIEGHKCFHTMEFAAKYNMGYPIAGNIFVARYDDSVPGLFQQLGLEID